MRSIIDLHITQSSELYPSPFFQCEDDRKIHGISRCPASYCLAWISSCFQHLILYNSFCMLSYCINRLLHVILVLWLYVLLRTWHYFKQSFFWVNLLVCNLKKLLHVKRSLTAKSNLRSNIIINIADVGKDAVFALLLC